jgi:hypothetical protein
MDQRHSLARAACPGGAKASFSTSLRCRYGAEEEHGLMLSPPLISCKSTDQPYDLPGTLPPIGNTRLLLFKAHVKPLHAVVWFFSQAAATSYDATAYAGGGGY